MLTGAGDVFSAGYDIGDLSPERLAEEAAELLTHPFEAALAALDAVAGAGGRRAGRPRVRRRAGARAGLRPARLRAAAPGWGCRRRGSASSTRTPGCGASWTRSAPPARASCSSPRGRSTRREALGWGLVNEVVDGRRGARASRSRREIAALSPLSLRGNKRVLQALIPPLDPALEAELDALRDAAFRSEDFAEGVRAFTEKRPPHWHGR